MRITAGATSLGAAHAMAGIRVFRNILAVGGGVEARPSSSRIKFRVRSKKQRAAADAVVGSVVVLIPILAAKSPLSPAATRYLILLRSKLLPPLCIGFADLVDSLFGHLLLQKLRCETNAKVAKTAARWLGHLRQEFLERLPIVGFPSRSQDFRLPFRKARMVKYDPGPGALPH